MKNSILLLFISTILFSCTKETIQPSGLLATVSSNANLESAASLSVVTFKSSVPGTIYISQGLNTLQTDSFTVSGQTAYMSKLVFVVAGSVNLSNFKFYINGGQIKSTITYSNDTITVALKKQYVLLPGNYNYILQAKTLGAPGTSFSTTLNSAIIVDKTRFAAEILNLPGVGNSLILR